jgi:hypothetical protein
MSDPTEWKRYLKEGEGSEHYPQGTLSSLQRRTGNGTKFCWFGISVVGCINHLIGHGLYKVGDKVFLAVMLSDNEAFGPERMCQHKGPSGDLPPWPQNLFLKSSSVETPSLWLEVVLKEDGDHKIDIIIDHRK